MQTSLLKRVAECLHAGNSDESTTTGWSEGGARISSRAGSSTLTTPRTTLGDAARSRGAELSSLSKVGGSPDSKPTRSSFRAPRQGAANMRPTPQAFLRKGSRMARSQPPADGLRKPSVEPRQRELRLQPRDAFKQAAAMVAERVGARSPTPPPLPRRRASDTHGVRPEKSFETPEREHASPCAFTPDAASAPARHGIALVPALGGAVNRCECHDSCRSSLSSERHTRQDSSGQSTHAETSQDLRFEADRQLRALDGQIEQFQRENEALCRLQEQSELAEHELAMEREQLRSEAEAERRALRAESRADREALQEARRQLDADMEQQRLAAASERLKLRERVDQLQEELEGRQRHWQRTVDRLQRQVQELTRINKGLKDELSQSCQEFDAGKGASACNEANAPIRRWAVPPARKRLVGPSKSDLGSAIAATERVDLPVDAMAAHTTADVVDYLKAAIGTSGSWEQAPPACHYGSASRTATALPALSLELTCNIPSTMPEPPLALVPLRAPFLPHNRELTTGLQLDAAESLAARCWSDASARRFHASPPPDGLGPADMPPTGRLLQPDNPLGQSSTVTGPQTDTSKVLALSMFPCDVASVSPSEQAARRRTPVSESTSGAVDAAKSSSTMVCSGSPEGASHSINTPFVKDEAVGVMSTDRTRILAKVEAEEHEVLLREVRTSEGRVERTFSGGRREARFPNGLRKVVWSDGRASVFFQNGDVKESLCDGTVVYHYLATQAIQTTYPDGTNFFCFANGQTERHFPDGSKEIEFPNGTTKTVATDGSEVVHFADGAVRRTRSGSVRAVERFRQS